MHKTYTDNSAKQAVFENVSYEFNSQGVYSIVGSSGSGKTTFLNLISGLDAFEKGSIEIDGRNLDTLSVEAKSALRKAKFGFGYQFHYLLDNLTIHENCLAACHGQDSSHITSILKKLELSIIVVCFAAFSANFSDILAPAAKNVISAFEKSYVSKL